MLLSTQLDGPCPVCVCLCRRVWLCSCVRMYTYTLGSETRRNSSWLGAKAQSDLKSNSQCC